MMALTAMGLQVKRLLHLLFILSFTVTLVLKHVSVPLHSFPFVRNVEHILKI